MSYTVKILHPQGTWMITTANAAYANLLCDRALDLGYYFSMYVI